MRRIFADAVYWVAIANRKDQWYAKAVTVMRSLGRVTLVTTEEVLDEFLAHYSGHGPVLRNLAAATVEKAMANPLVIVRPQSHQSFLDGCELYKARPDKEYSLTDCISMEVIILAASPFPSCAFWFGATKSPRIWTVSGLERTVSAVSFRLSTGLRNGGRYFADGVTIVGFRPRGGEANPLRLGEKAESIGPEACHETLATPGMCLLPEHRESDRRTRAREAHFP